MRIQAHQIYPVVALAVLAGATFWLQRVTAVDEEAPAAGARTRPDAVAEGTRLVSYGEDGRERYELLSDRATHFPLPDATVLDRPRLRYFGQGPEVRVTAETARVTEQGARVDLAGDVHARRDGAAEDPPFELDARTLTVWPDDQRAESHEPVVLTRAAAVAHADGMKADHLFGTLQLFGRVRVNMPRSKKTP